MKKDETKATPPVHIISNPRGGWSVKKEGASRAVTVESTKVDAVKIGRSLSKQDITELVIHKKEGTIERKDSHGTDKNPPKDKDTHKG